LTGTYFSELSVIDAKIGELGMFEITTTGGVYSADVT